MNTSCVYLVTECIGTWNLAAALQQQLSFAVLMLRHCIVAGYCTFTV